MSKNANENRAKHKTIVFLRHAKAEKETFGLPDFDRPLDARGVDDTIKLCTYLMAEPLTLDAIYCSASMRTRQTGEILEQKLKNIPALTLTPDLYLASAGNLLAFLNELPETQHSVMVIGHNPGLHQLSLLLAATGENAALESLQLKLSTCGMVRLSTDAAHWRDIVPACASLVSYITPKMLPSTDSSASVA